MNGGGFAPPGGTGMLPRDAAHTGPLPALAMPESSDEQLMLAYRDGDAGAFDVLYERHGKRLFRFLLRQCGQRHVAEELLQETWMRVIQARGRYEHRARFTTWLFRIAHNLLIDHYRRGNPGLPASFEGAPVCDPPDPDGRAQPERAAAGRQAADALLALIDGLPAAQREAFLMREEGGLSLEEIAEATGVGRETAKSRLRYAVSALRSGLQEYRE